MDFGIYALNRSGVAGFNIISTIYWGGCFGAVTTQVSARLALPPMILFSKISVTRVEPQRRILRNSFDFYHH